MGNSESANQGVINEAGYRISKVIPNGPLAQAGIEPFFDFVVSVEGLPVGNHQPLSRYLQDAPSPVILTVFSTRTRSIKEVEISRQAWQPRFQLGASVRFESFNVVEEEGLKVTAVIENSPCSKSGIQANQDWILGTTNGIFFKSHEDLVNSLESIFDHRKSSEDENLESFYDISSRKSNALVAQAEQDDYSVLGFLVFNSISETIRDVFIKLNPKNRKIGASVARVSVPMKYGSTERNQNASPKIPQDEISECPKLTKSDSSSTNHAVDSVISTEDTFLELESNRDQTVVDLLRHLSSTPKTWAPTEPPKNIPISEWISPRYFTTSDLLQSAMEHKQKQLFLENPAALGTVVSSQQLFNLHKSETNNLLTYVSNEK